MPHTVQQVQVAIEQHGYNQFAEDLRNQKNAYDYKNKATYVVGLGQVRTVDEVTQFEEGSVWIVFQTENDETLFRLSGYYDSYEGAEWAYGTVTEVEAREITTTVYEAVGR